MTAIKICGIKNENDISIINELLPEYAGFVFYERSKRNVSLDRAKGLLSMLDKRIKRVAVTVSPEVRLVGEIQSAAFDIIQIHGELSEESLNAAAIPIWRAVNIEEGKEEEFLDTMNYENKKISGIVVDGAGYGSGRPFNWRKSKRLLKAGVNSPPEESGSDNKLFVLAGGLNEQNVAEGIRLLAPDVVDVSSAVEDENGKSRELVKKFIETVRNYHE